MRSISVWDVQISTIYGVPPEQPPVVELYNRNHISYQINLVKNSVSDL